MLLVALTPMVLQVKNSTMEFVKNGGCVAVKTEEETAEDKTTEDEINQSMDACYNLATALAEYY